MAKRPKYDWEAIEREYRLGQKSLRVLSGEFGPDISVISRRAKKEGWIQDKTEEIRARTRAALATQQESNAALRIAVDVAVSANIEVIQRHRKIVSRTLDLAERLLDEADSAESIDIRAHGEMFRTISQGLAKAIPLERQARGIDDGPDTDLVQGIKIEFSQGAE